MNGWGPPSPALRRYDGQDWVDAIKVWVIKSLIAPRRRLVVRRDWLDGSHDFRGNFSNNREAARWISADSDRLRTAAEEAVYSVVRVSERAYQRHQDTRRCRSPHCPAPARPKTPSGEEFRGDLW